MECPHLGCSVGSLPLDSGAFPRGSPSSWSCEECKSDQSSWICLTCLQVHCGRYVSGHALKHFEDHHGDSHCVCMDCSNLNIFCYRCDEFVVNDTELGNVQRIRKHLQNSENSGSGSDAERKRKTQDDVGPENKVLKTNEGGPLAATGLRNLGNTCFMNAILQSLSNVEQFSCYFKALPAAAQQGGAGRMYHTRRQGDTNINLVEEVRKTLCSLWQGNQSAFSPDSLFYTIWKLMPSFRGFQQQDAHEFMRYLLDHLHRELRESEQEVSGDKEEAQGDKEEAQGDKEEAPGDEEEASGDKEEASGDKEEAQGDKEEAQGDKEEAPGDEEEASGDKEEASGDKEEAQGDKEEAQGDKEEAQGDKEEAQGDKEEAQGDKEEASGGKEEASGGKEEASGGKEEASGDKEEASGGKELNGRVSVVTSLFGGVLQNEVNCLICGTESRKFDPFLDLSLDIPRQFRQKKTKEQEPGPVCTLHDCLQSFTDLEELDETELYYCLKCKKRQKSTKKFWIKKLPKVLCLHLKRFHWTTFMRNKVDTFVQFPVRRLDMRRYLLQPESAAPERCLFDLAAIAVHHGSGVGSGHYTAYGCHDGRWFHFNDSSVTETDEEAVTRAKAYILFYTLTPRGPRDPATAAPGQTLGCV